MSSKHVFPKEEGSRHLKVFGFSPTKGKLLSTCIRGRFQLHESHAEPAVHNRLLHPVIVPLGWVF